MPWHTGLASLHTAILHESRVAETEAWSRTHSIRTSIGTMGHAHEGIVSVQDVSTVALAHIRSVADSIQTGLVTSGFASRGGRIESPSRGARTLLRSDTFSTATATAADRLTESNGVLRVPLLAGADIRTDAISILTPVAADGNALLVSRVLVTFVAETLFRSHADTVQAALRALGDTELLGGIQFKALLANALGSVTSHAILASNGTGGNALGELVENVVGIAGAEIGSHAEAVYAVLLTHRITLAQIVRVLGVSIAADVDRTEGGVGLEGD